MDHVRTATRIGNLNVLSCPNTNTFSQTSSAADFNFPQVGTQYGNKTIAVRIHKVRYHPHMNTGIGIDKLLEGFELHRWDTLTLVDEALPPQTLAVLFQKAIMENDRFFAISKTTHLATGTSSNASPLNQIKLESKEVEVDLLLPLDKILVVSYACCNYEAPVTTMYFEFSIGAELFWSYEAVDNMTFQRLKMEITNKLVFDKEPGTAVFN